MEYIINFEPIKLENIDFEYLNDIETKIMQKESVTNEEITYLLDSICYFARVHVNERMDNFENKCDLFQSILTYYFKKLGIDVYPCMTQNVITNDIVGHNFTLIKVLVDQREVIYLIDPSYIQFFKKENCQKKNYIVNRQYPYFVLLTPHPGYFVKTEDRAEIEFLLNHGYINLDENVARIYGDSFFNTKVGEKYLKLNFKTIPGSIYINSFLKGDESLSKSEEELYQMDLLITPLNHGINEIKNK